MTCCHYKYSPDGSCGTGCKDAEVKIAREKLAADVASLNPGDKVRATYARGNGKIAVIEAETYSELVPRHLDLDGQCLRGGDGTLSSRLVALEVLSRALLEEPGNEVLITSASCPSIWRLIDTGWWWDVTGVTPLRTWAELNDRYAPLTVMVPKP
jgi:hypothetical protein